MHASTAALASLRSYHHEHADDADRSSQQIPLVWSEPVYDDPPRERERNEDASVSGVDSPELRDGLQCGHHPVDRENSRPYQRPQEGLVFAHPPPHQVAAADLAQASQHEQPPMRSNRSISYLQLDCVTSRQSVASRVERRIGRV
jgi:hypothetical protein